MPDEFLHLPPGTIARRIADREIRGKASPADVLWLRNHPELWSRALRSMLRESESHRHSARLRLADHPERPKAATHPTPGYLTAVAEVKRLEISRCLFQRKVEEKRRVAVGYADALLRDGDSNHAS